VSPISKIFTRRVPVIECNGYSHIQKDWTAPTNNYINEKSLGARKLQGLIKIAIISYGYMCPREVDLSCNKLHYVRTKI
jgi:hypothetical protein